MTIPKQIRLRSVVILLACMLVVSSVSVFYAFSASTPTSGITDIYINPPMQESSYIIGIYTAPSTCYLQNGTTGQIATTGTFYTCLQGAIDASTSGDRIFIRAGNYSSSQSFWITQDSLYIEGEGEGLSGAGYGNYGTQIWYTGSSICFYYYSSGGATHHYFGGLKNIAVIGTDVVGSYGIDIAGYWSDLFFENCYFSHFGSGALLSCFTSGTSKIWNIYFTDCFFEDNVNYGIYFAETYSIDLRSIDRVKIRGCHFYNNQNSIFCNTQYVYHVTFTDNTVQSERQACINVTSGGRQWIVTDNQIFDCGISSNGTMAAIMVNGTGTYYPDSWLIENNVIANHFTGVPVATNNSVWLTGTVTNFGIQGNYFYVASEPVRLSGLVMTSDPKLIIQNNVGNFTWGDADICDVLFGFDGTFYYAVNMTSNTLMNVGTNASQVIIYGLGNLQSGIAFFKPAYYQMSGGFTIPASLKVQGAGANSTFFNVTQNLAYVIKVSDIPSYGGGGAPFAWAVEDLTINMNSYNGHGILANVSGTTRQHAGSRIWNVCVNLTAAGYSGFEIGNPTKMDIQHCILRSYGTGIHLYDTGGTGSFNWGDSSIRNCWIQNLGDDAVAVNFTSSTTDFNNDIVNIFVLDNIMVYGLSSLTGTYGFYFNHVPYLTGIGLHVEQAIHSIYLEDSRNMNFFGTVFYGTASGGAGFEVTAESRSINVVGGHLRTNGAELIDSSTVVAGENNHYRDIDFASTPTVTLGKNAEIYNCEGYSPVGNIGSPVSTSYLVDSGSGAIANNTAYTITNSPKIIFVQSDGTMLRTLVDGTAIFTTEEGFSLRLEPSQTVEFEWSSTPTILVNGA